MTLFTTKFDHFWIKNFQKLIKGGDVLLGTKEYLKMHMIYFCSIVKAL